jgi:hypothetical protein
VRTAVIITCLLVATAGCSKPTPGECDPACGPDEHCEEGTCIPYCDPPCPPGWYCYHPTGTCFYGSLPDGSTDSGWDPDPLCSSPDTDGDFIPDRIEGESDADGDTIPSFEDDDSDGDTILDVHEAGDIDCDTAPWDDDGDRTPDYRDLDSDDDTIPDAEEAGDDDPGTRPRDTDGWGHADFRDTDSDNDYLSDAQEETLGTDRLLSDTDGDGWDDATEVASSTGDPTDPDVTPLEDERIFVLYYRGRSQYEEFLFTVHYERNDVFLLVDSTWEASEAVQASKEVMAPVLVPEMATMLDGLRLGVAQFSGFRMPDVLLDPACRNPFDGLARIDDVPPVEVAGAYDAIPRCPEPLLGASLVDALYEVAGAGSDLMWTGACLGGIGGACFSPDARRMMFVLMNGTFPPGTPPGYGPHHTFSEVSTLLAERGVHVVGLVAADEMSDPAFGGLDTLARQTSTVDMYERPLAYLVGPAGENVEVVTLEAIRDAAQRMTADITLAAVDGADWPGGEEEVDATPLVTTIYPDNWSPPPGISPWEACRGVSGRSFTACVPDTEIVFTVYYRNYAIEQDIDGLILHARLELTSSDGYLFEDIPVSFVVPALSGDEELEE